MKIMALRGTTRRVGMVGFPVVGTQDAAARVGFLHKGQAFTKQAVPAAWLGEVSRSHASQCVLICEKIHCAT